MNQPLAEAIFWIASLGVIVGEAAILRSMFGANGVKMSKEAGGPTRKSEVAWAVIPALALSALLLVTWRRVEARQTHTNMDHSHMNPSMPMPPSGR